MIEELGSGINLIRKRPIRKIDKLGNESFPPRCVSRQAYAPGKDRVGVGTKARGFGPAVGLNRYYEFAELALQIRNQGVAIGGALDKNSRWPLASAEVADVLAQVRKVALFPKLIT